MRVATPSQAAYRDAPLALGWNGLLLPTGRGCLQELLNMPEVRPFRALRYDFNRFHGNVSSLIAPPYDVLDQEDKDRLLARNPYNIVAVDLPHIPPKDEGPAQAYLDAQFTLGVWTAEGTIVREEKPALYAYDQTFEHEGKKHTRHQFIAAVRLHDFSEGIVLPHERTFGGPKKDRLALTKETRCNISPVFGLYTDPDNQVGKALWRATQQPPDAFGNLEGVENRLWVLTDKSILETVAAAMQPKKIFIADGHHRYTTALNYRDHLAQMHGGLAPDHPANFVMLVLASMDDPGCIILGYGRVLVDEALDAAALMKAWSQGVAETDASDANLTLYDGPSGTTLHLKFTNRSILDQLAADRKPAWRKLDIAYLHRYLIDKLAAERLGHAPEIQYVKSQDMARRIAEERSGVALLPRPVPMEQLRAVSEADELMPQKSTYFYPKLATGLTIYPLYNED